MGNHNNRTLRIHNDIVPKRLGCTQSWDRTHFNRLLFSQQWGNCKILPQTIQSWHIPSNLSAAPTAPVITDTGIATYCFTDFAETKQRWGRALMCLWAVGPCVFHSKSLLTRTSGATSVHTYRAMQIQLEEIFTHTDGHLLVMASYLESGLPRERKHFSSQIYTMLLPGFQKLQSQRFPRIILFVAVQHEISTTRTN